MRYIPSTLALIAGILVFTCAAGAEPPSQDDGIEVLARGPVHEAYAEPTIAAPRATSIIARQPPALLDEVPADQKPDGDVQWISGYWAWDEDRNDFLWVSGFWRLPPPGRDWIPGHWVTVDGGWQWVPGFWAESDQEELAYYPPPPESVDAGPSVPPPTATSVFVPGNWVHRETGYRWRPGFWSDYRPGWLWVPAHYVWTPAGYLYVEGYWDYPLRERGLLFAPVAIDWNLVSRPHWSYRPGYVVNDECLLGALFVNPGCDHYYFGDYFDAGYRGRGFISWLDFRFGHGGDPLYGYYRSCYGADSRWEHGLRDLYEGRFSGALARPPRTLIQQNTVVQNFTNTTTINNINNVTNVQNVTMLTPLAQVSPAVARLQPVTDQGAALRVARQRLAVDAQRGKLESQFVAQSFSGSPAATGLAKTTATPQVRKISLPRAQGDRVSAPINAPAPLTVNHSGAKPPLPSSAVSAKPHITQSSTIPAARPLAKERLVTPYSTTPSVAKTPAVATKPLSPHAVTQPSVSKPAPEPQVVPAPKRASQPRVAYTPEPAANRQVAEPRPAPKPQTAPTKPAAPPSAPPTVRSPAVSAPKPAPKVAAKPAEPPAPKPIQPAVSASSRPAVKPQTASTPKSAARPQAAPTPKPAAKAQATPARPAAQPAPKPIQPAVVSSRPAVKPQAAPAKPAAAPAKPAPPRAAKQSAPQGNSKDHKH